MRYCFLLIILLFLIGCQPDELPADRYVQWVNTKLKSQASNEEFDFSLHYQPSAYQALRELEEVNEKEFEKILGDYEGHHYINFHVRNKNGKKIEIDNVLRFNARDKFRAIINGDTLPCVLYHVSEMNERLQIALVFRENKAIEELKTIQFRCDENKFCSGVLEMEIPKRYIQQCPNLVL